MSEPHDPVAPRTHCDYCGSVLTHCHDEPDSWVIKCIACGKTDRIWKDNEYEEESDE